MKKKILITGSTGFIGRNLSEQLKIDYNTFSPSSKQLNLLEEDNVKKYLQKNRFNIVIHCATHNATVVSDKNLSLVFKSNLRMFFNLARLNKLYGKMFYFGSGAEYDKRFYMPKMKEDYFDKHVPVDDYGFSKYIMAKYIKNTPNIYDLRLFGVFGKYEDWRIRFISNVICMAIYDMDIKMNQNVYFDYLYIDDLVKIVKKLIQMKTIPYQYVNVCTGYTTDLLSLAKLIIKTSGKNLKIKIKKQGLGKEYSGNNNKLLKILYEFEFTKIEQSINELYQWYNQNKKNINKDKIYTKR